MIFWCEQKMKLYVCQHDWNDKDKVVQVLTHKHVAGEQYDTEYTPTKMQILATQAEMINLDREIMVEDVSYRLDLGGLRIKHLAQAAKTTTTASGKANKGQLSWQTFRKFDCLGDLAYAWFELGGMLWQKFEPYVAPHDLDGSLQIPETSEPVEGEVLPPVKSGSAPALPPALATRVQSIYALHDEIEAHLASFAECIVKVGMELLSIRKEVGHGRWEKFFAANISCPRFQLRHAQRYMEVAKAFQAKLAQREGVGAALLLTGEAGGDGGGGEAVEGGSQASVIRETLADMTDARSWQQLWMDFGLLRSKKTQGGNHGGGAAMHEKAINRHAVELMNALDQWQIIISNFRDFALTHQRVLRVPPPTLEEGMASIRECCRAVDKIISKG